jgi:hypothetical protein
VLIAVLIAVLIGVAVVRVADRWGNVSVICVCLFAGCLQKHRREKVRLASQSGIPVYRQTQVEQWVTGVVDTISGKVTFRADVPGRAGRTLARQLVFIENYTQPFTTLVTDESKLYNSDRLLDIHRWHHRVNHQVCVCVWCVCVCVLPSQSD